ncbi:MAG: flagellar biosynthesis anti-sigma factor FlgM [Anaerovoracaceae bacterium]|jgi:anti-sigma28 factor (negative regulator of flagellin synthesis)
MEISFIGKSKAVQPQKTQDVNYDPAKNISTEENKKYVLKNKVDSAEISSSYSGSFDDKRITVAKSAILYEASLSNASSKVEELKTAIKSGTYYVSSESIADKILGE